MLKNGIKIIYTHRNDEITSLCIGFNSGALEEEGRFNPGTAHALEHLISKGTIHRTEDEINAEFDHIFGFENAMTNYPYTIYYGSSLSDDINSALELYSDILLNPLFSRSGFRQEMDIIIEELREWHSDMYQYCEDELFRNSFKKRRIRELIIGSECDIRSITLEDIVDFYNCFYTPDNCVISFSTSLDFESVCSLVEKYFGKWQKNYKHCVKNNTNQRFEFCNYETPLLSNQRSKRFTTNQRFEFSAYEKNLSGIYVKNMETLQSAKIQYIFDISSLTDREFKALLLFNSAFGEGTSSFLYKKIRTENAAAYEVGSHIKNDRGIKLLSINMGTSAEKISESIESIDYIISEIIKGTEYFKEESIRKLAKRVRLKRALKLEKSIQLCKELATYELMYGNYEKLYGEIEDLNGISEKDIYNVIGKVLKDPSIQILK